MKKILITSCIITIMALAPLSSAFAADDATGTTAAAATDNDKMQKNENTMKDDEKMKATHDKIKGNGDMKDMKDMPM